MTLMLVFDIAFAVLLVVTIGYAIVLNRKLGNLRRHKDELEGLASTFSKSTASAEDSVQRLKSSIDELQRGIDKAQGLRDDLTFLIDRGTLAADRLEDCVRGARNQDIGEKPEMPKRPVEPIETISDAIAARRVDSEPGHNFLGNEDIGPDEDDIAKQKSQAERDLIEALRQVR